MQEIRDIFRRLIMSPGFFMIFSSTNVSDVQDKRIEKVIVSLQSYCYLNVSM